MKAVFAAMLAALVLSACGAVGGGAAPPSGGSPSSSSIVGFDVTATENTHAIAMRAGQTLAVVLHARPGMTNWTNVRSSDQSVLAPVVNPAATAARGVTLAAFKAIAPGTARIDATAGPLCSPGVVCPQYLVLLTIEITINVG